MAYFQGTVHFFSLLSGVHGLGIYETLILHATKTADEEMQMAQRFDPNPVSVNRRFISLWAEFRI